MNEVFKKNLELYKKISPTTAQKVESAPDTGTSLVSIGDSLYDIQLPNGLFRYGKDPLSHAKKSVNLLDAKFPRFVISYGLGLGYHLEEFFNQYSTTKFLVIVEKSLETFRHFLSLKDQSKWLTRPNTFFVIGQDLDKIQLFFEDIIADEIFDCIKTLTPLFDTTIPADDHAYYASVADIVKNTGNAVSDILFNSSEDCYRGFMNIMNNLESTYGTCPFDLFENRFEDCIGIAVSTGPSLEHSIEWLKKVGDRAIIACTDSAVKVLLGHGIRPHFVGCCERVPETKLLFDQLPDLYDTPLLANPILWPESYQMYPGPKVNIMRPIGQLRWFFPECKSYFTGSSVSHLLYIGLRTMGCSKIFLVGQDLAFDRYSEKTHVSGMPNLLVEVGKKQREESQKKVETSLENECLVEGNDGQPILTMEWYNQFNKEFTAFIRRSKVPCYNVIPANYGAKIPGAIWMDPKEAEPMIQPQSKKIRHRVLSILDERPRITLDNFRHDYYSKLLVAQKHLSYLRKTSVDILDCVSQFRQQFSPVYYPENTFDELFQKVEMISSMLMDDPEHFYDDFFSAQMMKDSLAIIQASYELINKKNDPIQTIECKISLIRMWFQAIQYWASRMDNYIENYLNQVRASQTDETQLQGISNSSNIL